MDKLIKVTNQDYCVLGYEAVQFLSSDTIQIDKCGFSHSLQRKTANSGPNIRVYDKVQVTFVGGWFGETLSTAVISSTRTVASCS
jgi:hypothetical protein